MNKKINIGDIRQNLKLLEVLPNKINKNHTRFICECLLCGNKADIPRNKWGKQKSCGCIMRITGENNRFFRGYKEIHKGKWETYVRNAKKRNIDFDVSIEYAYDIFQKQNKKCAITKEPIYFWESATIKRCTASLDRIDNNKGYIEGNIHWVHKKINQIKMDMDLQEFIQWCEKVVETNKGA